LNSPFLSPDRVAMFRIVTAMSRAIRRLKSIIGGRPQSVN